MPRGLDGVYFIDQLAASVGRGDEGGFTARKGVVKECLLQTVSLTTQVDRTPLGVVVTGDEGGFTARKGAVKECLLQTVSLTTQVDRTPLDVPLQAPAYEPTRSAEERAGGE